MNGGRASELPAGPSTGPALWTSTPWLATATAWLDERLAAVGRVRSGPVEQPRVRPWSTVLRAPTGSGPVWLKCPAPSTVFEVGLYAVLDRWAPEAILRPIALDIERGWLLLPDGGESLNARLAGAEEARALGVALVRFGALQRQLVPAVDELLAAGVPDMRPAQMPERFEEAVAAAAGWVRDGSDRELLRQVIALRPVFATWCARLAAHPSAPSLDHNDLHADNVVGERYLDWGDSVIAHPFAVALVPLRLIADLLPAGSGSTDYLAARNGYLAGFAGDRDPSTLVSTLELAGRVTHIARALTWERALRAATDADEPIDERWRTGALFWLAELLHRAGDR